MGSGRQVVVLGGSAGGLLTALVLANGGNPVTVLERDAEPPPRDADEAWNSWQRRGVPQFRQPHGLPVRFMDVLDAELPAVAATVRSIAPSTGLAGSAPNPDELTDRERAFSIVLVRRPTLEMLLAEAADAHPDIEVRRGCAATGLVLGPSEAGRLHVIGVSTGDGGTVTGDIVVDCSGRRSAVGGWLAELGSPIEESAEPDGFTYASRWFHLSGDPPTLKAGTFGGVGPGLLSLIFPSDGNAVGIAMVGSARDPLFRRVQRPEPFMAVARSFPLVAEWLEPGGFEPITDIMPMGSIQNRMTRLRRDDTSGPVGIINTSDAFASTNPSLGRGLGITADLAVRLRDLLADEPDAVALVDRWDDVQQRCHKPWLDDSIASDANLRSGFDALLGDDPGDIPHPWRSNLAKAAGLDLDCWRAVNSVNQILASPTTWLDDTELLDRAATLAAELPPATPSMTRAELEELTA
jgi:2-polyprenyl-6-methoxyphenol hydroxylase-like FAD-dependent oxidoreductase